MPTIITHAVVPLAVAVAAGRQRIAIPIAFAGAALAALPDVDVAGFALGIAYGDDWGHRGATHSLAFAALVAGALGTFWRNARSATAALFLFGAIASHGLLDMLTDGGLGVALSWPFDHARYFFAVTPIRVSPIGVGFFSARGLDTLLSEFAWVWLPCCGLALVGLGWRRLRAP